MSRLNRRSLFAALAVTSAGALAGCVMPPQQVVVPQQIVPQAGCDTRFQVVNQSGGTVREFYFSHSSLSSFGVDQLGQNVLQPGQAMSFVANNPGNYDFRAVFMNGARRDLYRVNICAASRITITGGGLIAQ
ncbi:hypothetical protein [Plastoroseomonas hellenica]|uniref:Uncharacterized protein n=1 Tax=Plastoroseomonas hellenica TaxID=2687306 RepID=A0ABS5F8E1_9PROT|nr:hypothetical protein [Plastoroseomonas hellenica]MBR0646068.1 hypothetical protein [Plastoroseomonas hellenica]MBR0668771.1 hypothetical protein [Plastoroseomonas hellenica]